MFRYLFELISALFIFGLIRSVVSAIARIANGGGTVPNPAYRASQNAGNKSADSGEMRTLGELRKDPVCGTFVAMNTPYTRIVEGTTKYFCSKECRDLYKSGRTQDPWPKSTAARS
jgi:YHS domain-containing protein